MGRSFEDITKELGSAMNRVVDRKANLDKVTAESDEMIKEANKRRSEAANELFETQKKAMELRAEYDSLMTELLPAQGSHVRQSK